MGAKCLSSALKKANLKLGDLDLIISANATYDYPIPHQAPLTKKELNAYGTDVPCISIDSTCLSFVTALDISSYLLDGDRFRRIAIVTSEISSRNLNPEDFETFTLFGDGSACAIVEYCADESSFIIASNMITLEEGAEETIVRGGGLKYPFSENSYDASLYCFQMKGKNLLKLAKKSIKPFIEDLLNKAKLKAKDIDCFVPHQASKMGLYLLEKLYPAFKEKVFYNLSTHGNCIAASIPMAIFDATESHKINRGDTLILAGTSAGFSIGGMILKY